MLYNEEIRQRIGVILILKTKNPERIRVKF